MIVLGLLDDYGTMTCNQGAKDARKAKLARTPHLKDLHHICAPSSPDDDGAMKARCSSPQCVTRKYVADRTIGSEGAENKHASNTLQKDKVVWKNVVTIPLPQLP